jgi:hypothetical protein
MRVLSCLLALAATLPGCGKWGLRTSQSRLPASEGLAVGQLAPEIAGVDAHGNPLRLSDYRGRVVVLDFWGNW